MSPATSSGVPGLPAGVCSPQMSSSGGEESVRIHPGATAFDVIPCCGYLGKSSYVLTSETARVKVLQLGASEGIAAVFA